MICKQVISMVLPGVKDSNNKAHITGHYGELRKVYDKYGNHVWDITHLGLDLNYEGGQAGVNLKHPPVYSPINGRVTNIKSNYNTVTITDNNGNTR